MSEALWIIIGIGISLAIIATIMALGVFIGGLVVLIVALIKTNSRKHKQKKDIIDVEAKVVDEKKE